MGLGGFGGDDRDDDDGGDGGPVFMVLPSPAFQNDLGGFLDGLRVAYPRGKTFGGIASTVSSLSRARVFAYSAPSRSTIGAIVLDEAATVEEDEAGGEEYDDRVDASDGGSGKDDDDDDGDGDATSEARKREAKRARLLADYAKARVPKPPLAESNFVMNRLSDDNRAFMRRTRRCAPTPRKYARS